MILRPLLKKEKDIMNKTNITKIITSVLLALLLVGTIGLIAHFTNGFREDFKTFYVTYEGEDILSEKSKLALPRGEEHRFDVTYIFEDLDEETASKGYSVEVVSNAEKGNELAYTVDAEKITYVDGMYLTNAFQIDKQDTYFTLTLPEDISLEKVLESVYEKNVEVPNDVESTEPYLYTLLVSSYDESVIYYIDFAFHIGVTGVTLDKSEVVF